MLLLIDSCQNRVSADQYHLNVSQAQFWPIEVNNFLKLSADKLLVFKWSQVQVDFFKIQMKYVVFMSLWPRTIKILVSNWPRTRKFSQSFKITGMGDLFLPWLRSSSHFYALIGRNLTGEFMFIQHLETCLLWQLNYRSWQSFVSTCDAPLDVPNELQLLSRVFCYSWLVCFLGFWLRNASLDKVGNPIWGGIVFVFHLAWCVILRV